jgi:DNA-3-methyladenine glycosylase II
LVNEYLDIRNISPTPPFNFDLSASIFSSGNKQFRKYENGKLWQVIKVDHKLILVIMQSSGTVEKPEMSIDMISNKGLSNVDREMAGEVISHLFNLKLDLELFYTHVRNDKIMSRLSQQLRGLKNLTTPTIFEALVSSIIEQQISSIAARSIKGNVIKTFGENLKVNNEIYYAFPAPKRLAQAKIEQLRKCGLSLKKTQYVLDISSSILERRLNLDKFLEYEDANEIIRELDRIPGIGIWTAELTMLRGMQRLDVIPADDLNLRRCVSHYYYEDKQIHGEDVRRIAERWGKWKGLASYYLTIAIRLGTEI